MITLAIDASTYRGTVAIVRDGSVIATSETAMRGEHAEGLMPAVVAALASAGVATSALDRVVCGAGPGSFTSLRIAAGIAKGLAFGAGVPLYAVPSLALMLAASSAPTGTYAVTLDALRDDWYAGIYARASDGVVSELRPAMLVAKQDLRQFAVANGATVLDDVTQVAEPSAAGCVALAALIERSGPVDLDRWEPAYGRLAEAQVRWEATHGRSLGV